jgi:PIN domain nuclease of toxin-antitoxin system
VILLDTHILVWAAGNERKLGRKARTLIEKHWKNGEVAVSTLTFWEAGMLQERGRLQLVATAREWRDQLLAAGLTELPLTGPIALRALDLSGLPGDPADRFIVATALEHGTALVTADEKLLNWRHALERHDGTA